MGITLFLLLFLLKRVKKNQMRDNRRGVSFLLPVLTSLLLLFHGILHTFPKMVDAISVMKGTYPSIVTGTIEDIGFLQHTMKIDGTVYYFNPFAFKPKEGEKIQGEATQYAHYMVYRAEISVPGEE